MKRTYIVVSTVFVICMIVMMSNVTAIHYRGAANKTPLENVKNIHQSVLEKIKILRNHPISDISVQEYLIAMMVIGMVSLVVFGGITMLTDAPVQLMTAFYVLTMTFIALFIAYAEFLE